MFENCMQLFATSDALEKFFKSDYVQVGLYIIGGFILGFILEKIFLMKIRKLAVKKQIPWAQITLKSLKWLVPFWFVMIGGFIVTYRISIGSAHKMLIFKAIVVLFIITIIILLVRLAKGFIRHYSKKAKGEEEASSILENIVKVAIIVVGGLMIMMSIGISIEPLIAALGVGGLAVAFAVKPTLVNLFAGLQILLSDQIAKGDYVKLDTGAEGKVKDIGWRNTSVESLGNNLVVIPNGKLSESVVTIYNRPDEELSINVACGIDYNTDLEKVEQIAIEVTKTLLEEVAGGVKTAEPIVRFKEFADSSINFKVYFRAENYVAQFKLKHELMKRLHKRFADEGINIPFPIMTVKMDK